MQKFALPVIFITAVAGTLFYVSQEEHGTGTLLLLAAVLLVGQICATLPYIFESRKPRPGAVSAKTDDGNANKIIGNQQVIHEDLRSLGDALIKRFNALSERQDALEKTLLAAVSKETPELADNLNEIFEKQERRFDERFETLAESLGEKLTPAPQPDTSAAKFDAVNSKLETLSEKTEELGARVDEVLFVLGNLPCGNNDEDEEESEETEEFAEDDGADEEPAEESEDADVLADGAEGDEEIPADDENVADGDVEDDEEDWDDLADDEEDSDVPETADTADADPDASEDLEEDFPEDDEFAAYESDDDSAQDSVSATEQGELQLGDLPPAKGATLVLDAMLGIENKPYLRGNAPGLSLDEGTPMDFVEIGRWSYDFAPLTEEVSVKILRNDRDDDPLGDAVTLAPGQTLELSYVPDRH